MKTVLRSRTNERVQRWRRLVRDARARRAERRIVLEGEHLAEALLASGGRPRAAVVREGREQDPRMAALLDRLGCPVFLAAPGVLAALAEARSPAALLVEADMPEAAGPQRSAPAARSLLLDGVQDPGNVGAILRSAAAFGVETVYFGRGCADAWSAKSLRAAAGAHFALRLALVPNPVAVLERFHGAVIAAIAHGGISLGDAQWCEPVLWLFGAEGKGLDAELVRRATLCVSVPTNGRVESLNVAAAATLCLYEAWRRCAQ